MELADHPLRFIRRFTSRRISSKSRTSRYVRSSPDQSCSRSERFIPPRHSARSSNGGYGGVHFALRYGVRLGVAGRTEDKMEVTARVGCSGAGVNLHTQRPKPAAIARAVAAVRRATPRLRGSCARWRCSTHRGRQLAAVWWDRRCRGARGAREAHPWATGSADPKSGQLASPADAGPFLRHGPASVDRHASVERVLIDGPSELPLSIEQLGGCGAGIEDATPSP